MKDSLFQHHGALERQLPAMMTELGSPACSR